MTRINDKFTRLYVNGVDISGYASEVGALAWTFGAEPAAALSDAVMNAIAGRCTISAGDINTLLDNDTAGAFVLANSGDGTKIVTVAYGTNAVPADGDPVFSWGFEETGYMATGGAGYNTANISVGNASYSSTLAYRKPWGVLLHPSGAETAANTVVGIDDLGASSALGGIFVYHLLSSDGTVTLSVEDAATNLNASFAALSGATSGSITAETTPASGMIALGATATVRRYLRWQLVLGTATTATFVCAFIRNNL
jgi:hypothetical protein